MLRSLLLRGRGGLVAEVMASVMDEHVLQARLAERHRANALREGGDQVAQEFVAARMLDPQLSVDNAGRDAELLFDLVGKCIRLIGLHRERVAADGRTKLV